MRIDSQKNVWPYVPGSGSFKQRNAMRRNKTTEKAAIRKMEKNIRRRANYSLAVLGMGFVRNGSGQFLNIRSVSDRYSGVLTPR
jgi:hypothetical protein